MSDTLLMAVGVVTIMSLALALGWAHLVDIGDLSMRRMAWFQVVFYGLASLLWFCLMFGA